MSFHSLWEKYATLARRKLGFDPIQNRSGLKTGPQRVLSALSVSILHPIIRPSSALGPHAEHELACMQKKRTAAQRCPGSSWLCSRSEQLYQHQQTTNSDLVKASRPPGGIFLNQLTLFTKDRTQMGSPELYLQQQISWSPTSQMQMFF